MKPFLIVGRYCINVQSVTHTERREDRSVRVYFVGRDDFLLIEPPESELLLPLLRDLSIAPAETHAVPETHDLPQTTEKLQEIGSRVEELRRTIEETARTITPPDQA